MNDVLNEHEVAEILDCEPATVKEKARNGELPAVKFGRSWRFPRSALMEALHQKALANKPKISTPVAIAHKLHPSVRRLPPVLPQTRG